MKIIKLQSKQEYDSLMARLESEGYRWLSGHKPTEFIVEGVDIANDFAVCLEDSRTKPKCLHYSRWSYRKINYPQATFLTYDEYMNNGSVRVDVGDAKVGLDIPNPDHLVEIGKYKQGDILVNGEGNKKILGICGEVYLMSATDDHKAFDAGYTLEELDGAGYTLDTSDQDEEKAIQLLTERGRIKEGKIVQ